MLHAPAAVTEGGGGWDRGSKVGRAEVEGTWSGTIEEDWRRAYEAVVIGNWALSE